MALEKYLRPSKSSEISVLKDVYRDGVYSLPRDMYSQAQIDAWSSLSFLPGVLDKPLQLGKCWVSCIDKEIEAFGVRYPSNRLALLYCRGRSFRQGHATALLQCIELEALHEGQTSLITEASLCSYKLLVRLGWTFIKPEKILIGGVKFDRYVMKTSLNNEY